MISQEQCKHVIKYYVMKMMSPGVQITVPSHVTRDCIFLNKMRGELCANLGVNPILKNIFEKLHRASSIEQVNSIPKNNKCYIENKNIPTSNGGIQLIIHFENSEKMHICIQKKYQKLCYAYFKLRHFPVFIENFIKNWLINQSWYVPHTFNTQYINSRIENSILPNIIHTHLSETVDTLTQHSI